MERERIRTHIIGLDERMQGGIPTNYIVLLCGRAGTMKSSVGYSILYNAAKNKGKKCMYLTLEQNREDLMDHMQSLGYDLAAANIAETLTVMDLGRMRSQIPKSEGEDKIDWIHSIITAIEQYKQTFGMDVLLLDSMSALYSLAEFKNPRAELFHFFEKLRTLKITVLLVSEMYSKESYGLYGVEDFLSDGILHLDMSKERRNVNLFLGIAKMRRTKHERGYFPLIFENGEFEIVTN
jgi:KaiC/GvpD/RAD55 family RecA-like ATPase